MAKKTTTTDKQSKAKAAKPAKGKAAGAKATAKKAEPKKAKAPKAETKPVARGPLARVKALAGSKDELVKKLVEPLAHDDQDPDALGDRLRKASNQQLLRLLAVVETVKQKYGSRDKLIESLGKTLGKAKDNDYLARLRTFSLPRLLDLAKSAERRGRQSA